MKPTTVTARATVHRPNRVLVVLAAAWMILSLAIGGAMAADSREAAATETGTSIAVDRR